MRTSSGSHASGLRKVARRRRRQSRTTVVLWFRAKKNDIASVADEVAAFSDEARNPGARPDPAEPTPAW